MKLKAAEVQKMLDVEDKVIVAHGYTFDRATLDVWFEKGHIVRREYVGKTDKELERWETDLFEPGIFRDKVKRWYLGEGDRKINSRLLELFETFGSPLSTTSGGRYP